VVLTPNETDVDDTFPMSAKAAVARFRGRGKRIIESDTSDDEASCSNEDPPPFSTSPFPNTTDSQGTTMDAPLPFHERLPSPDANQERNTTPENTTISEQDQNHIYDIEEQQETLPYVHPFSSPPPPFPLPTPTTLPSHVPQLPDAKSCRKRRHPDRFHEDQELLNQKCRRMNPRSTAVRTLNPDFAAKDFGILSD
jgi:hypothetical protein